MNVQRNIIMLAALGVVVLLYVGDIGYRKLVEEPKRKREQTKTTLEKRIRDARLSLAKGKQSGAYLERMEQQSLPWNSQIARARYQAWLIELARDAGLSGTSVDSGEPVTITRTSRTSKRPIEMYTRYTFSVRGRGDLRQVTQFMYDFYRSDQLQKIRSFSLSPQGDGQVVDASFSIEALSLPLTERETELSDAVSNNLAHEDSQTYRFIAQRNLFGPGGANFGWRQLTLTAVTIDARGSGQAWFAAGKSKETRILRAGEVLTIPSLTVKLLSVNDRSAIVEVDQQQYRMQIGQSLAEATVHSSGQATDTAQR
jgi:hypothetical protein